MEYEYDSAEYLEVGCRVCDALLGTMCREEYNRLTAQGEDLEDICPECIAYEQLTLEDIELERLGL